MKHGIIGLVLGFIVAATLTATARNVDDQQLAARATICNGDTSARRDAKCTNYKIVDAGTDATTRTATANVDGFNRLVANVWLVDANTDCTSIESTCTVSVDGGSTWASVTSRSISSGTGTVSAFADTTARTAAIAGVSLVYDIWGAQQFKCVYSLTGTCASDTITAQWSLAAGK